MPNAVSQEDRRFFEHWKQGSEYSSSNPKYEQSLQWNLGHIDRGEQYVAAVTQYKSVAGCRVLDVGCGSGGVCIAFARHGARCTGVEPSAERFRWASVRTRDHGVDVELRHSTLEAAGLPDRSYDIILATDVLEPVDDYRRVLREMCRLLAPGGVIYATVPNCFHPRNLLAENHTGLFGLLLMPMPWREFDVVKIRRYANSYPVSHFPPCHRLVLEAKKQGIDTLVPVSFRRLQHVNMIRTGALRWLSKRSVPNAVAHRLVSWLALPRTYTFVATRART